MSSALHKSQIGMFFGFCELAFEKRYLDGVILPPNAAMLTGSAVHHGAEFNLKHKSETGAALALEDVADLVSLDFDKRWSAETPELLNPDEKAKGAAAVKGAAKDKSIALAKLHANVLVPKLDPIKGSVERAIRVAIPGLRHEIEGTLDLQTPSARTSTGKVLHDLKTSAKKLDQGALYDGIDMPLYSLLLDAADKERPESVALDVLQKLKREDKAYIVEGPPPPSHEPIIARIQLMERALETGVFRPAASDSWQCSTKWCGLAARDACPFGPLRRRAAISMSSETEEEG